jgi:hypothetical protein
MYVLAIGLLIFNLAGGSLVAQSTTGILSVHLKHPGVVLLAAWAGFFYFWWRFWLVSRARPFADFIRAANWQLGNLSVVRAIAKQYVTPRAGHPIEQSIALLMSPAGPVPKVELGSMKLSLQTLKSASDEVLLHSFGSGQFEIPAESRWPYRRAKLVAIYRAITCERIFTDYTLPHLFALLTVAVGIWRFAHDFGAIDAARRFIGRGYGFI